MTTARAVALVGLLAVLLLGIREASWPSEEGAPSLVEMTLAGSHDVELTYEIDDVARQAVDPKLLRSLVVRRLAAGNVSADVTVQEGRTRVVVDEALASRVDELVTWTGTLLVVFSAPNYVLPPPSASSGLTSSGDGREAWYEGSRTDVLRAARAWEIDGPYRVLAEPIWTSEGLHEPTPWRTRVVTTDGAGELSEGALVSWGDGSTLRIRGQRGSPAESLIATTRARATPHILARGPISLGAPKIEADTFTLTFEPGSQGYARAQHERKLLASPRLPRLGKTRVASLPPNRTLAFACLVVPALLSLAWLWFVRRFDRAHPEPIWLVALTFLLGALATVPAALAERALASLSPWLDPQLVTFGGHSFAFPLAAIVFTAVVGLPEEGAKRLAAEVAFRRREFDEPIDGIIYGIVASLGFAAAENVRYFALGRLNTTLVVARCFMSIPAHMFFSALWGHALGAKLVDRRKPTWAWLLVAAGAHGLSDALLSTEGAGLLAIMVNVGLGSVFVVLVRRALRHGVVTNEMLDVVPESRVFFRVGRPAFFWASIAIFHALALGIFLLGAYDQIARYRPSATFVLGSSVMLMLLAVAALGISTTLPLDLVIDTYGVTFAGAARPWRRIRGFAVHVDRVAIDCEGGSIAAGPASPDVVAAISAELTERLGADGRSLRSTTPED